MIHQKNYDKIHANFPFTTEYGWESHNVILLRGDSFERILWDRVNRALVLEECLMEPEPRNDRYVWNVLGTKDVWNRTNPKVSIVGQDVPIHYVLCMLIHMKYAQLKAWLAVIKVLVFQNRSR